MMKCARVDLYGSRGLCYRHLYIRHIGLIAGPNMCAYVCVRACVRACVIMLNYKVINFGRCVRGNTYFTLFDLHNFTLISNVLSLPVYGWQCT